MIDANKIDEFANNLSKESNSELQTLFANNNASESDLLNEFTKEVDSPFLKDNRRKPSNLKKDEQEKTKKSSWWNSDKPQDKKPEPAPTEPKPTGNSQPETDTPEADEEEYSFDDLDEGGGNDEEQEDSKEFSKDIITFLMEGIDYGANKGAELMGYEKRRGSSDLKRQKDAVIKYGTLVMEKYDFKLKPEHMLMIALVFYIKAVSNNYEKESDPKNLQDIPKSNLKLVKPDRNGTDKKEQSKKEVKVKQSLL